MLRITALPAVFVSLLVPAAIIAAVPVDPAPPRQETLKAPTPAWFMVTGMEASYLFDGDSGEMQGLISHGWYTPAVEPNVEAGEFYLTESFYSRGVTGERTDVVTIVDLQTLSTKAEVVIPPKTGALPFRHHIGLMGNKRFVGVFNMTPAQSISIVDVIGHTFIGEISTPGCAMIMPSGDSDFLMICGDGTLQLIRLSDSGTEAKRIRSSKFFVVEEDPVFAQPEKTTTGWLLVSHDGRVFDVTVHGDKINVSKPWTMQNDADSEEKWRPGGGQAFTFDRNSNLLYALMHQGEQDTHSEPGSEIWVFDVARKHTVARMKLEVAATNILVSEEPRPKLYVFDVDSKIQIVDGLALKRLRTIDEPGRGLGLMLLQRL
jgi:methylamine dehydrogenase heavy chain